MGSRFKLLIGKIVVSDHGVSWTAALLCVMMRANHGAPERMADDWGRLLQEAGFAIEQTFTYLPVLGLSIIVAVAA